MNSQNKSIKGDTTYWYNHHKELNIKLGIEDLSKAKNFTFRFRNLGQIVELVRSEGKSYGKIYNYTYHTRRTRRKRDTLFNEISISSSKARKAIGIIVESGVLNLKSDKDIKGWGQGFDGVIYFIEYKDSNRIVYNNYWTPSAQDSLPEALIISEFVTHLSELLKLKDVYKNFIDGLPKKGCYNRGGLINRCFISNALEVGYSGALKLPYGIQAGYHISYLGRKKLDMGAGVRYVFDRNGNHHLRMRLSKWNLFFDQMNKSDYVSYQFQHRDVRLFSNSNYFQNHQIIYGKHLNKFFSVGAGFDYIETQSEKVGGLIYATNYIQDWQVSSDLILSIFDDQLNYDFNVYKSFNLNYDSLIHQISFGVGYQNFYQYKDLYFSLTVSI